MEKLSPAGPHGLPHPPTEPAASSLQGVDAAAVEIVRVQDLHGAPD